MTENFLLLQYVFVEFVSVDYICFSLLPPQLKCYELFLKDSASVRPSIVFAIVPFEGPACDETITREDKTQENKLPAPSSPTCIIEGGDYWISYFIHTYGVTASFWKLETFFCTRRPSPCRRLRVGEGKNTLWTLIN